MTGQSKAEMSKLQETLINLSMYGGGAFYCYPHKPLLNAAFATGYENAYRHFRRDHADPTNLAFHILCMVLQLGGNFGWLNELDGMLASILPREVKAVPSVSLMTAAAWSAVLLRSSAPPAVKAGCAASLVAAYLARGKLAQNWIELSGAQGLLDVSAVQLLILKKPLTHLPTLLPLVALRVLLYLAMRRQRGCLKQHKAMVNVLIGLFIAATTAPNPFKLSFPYPIVLMGLFGWIPAILTDQPALYLYSLGFSATLGQGVAHNLSGELATLPQLQNLPDEHAHSTFFPALLLQSCLQSLKAAHA